MPYESACPPYAHSAAQARAAIVRAHTNLAPGSELGVTKVTAPAKVSDTTGTTPGGCSILADRSGAAVRAQPACRARPAARPPACLPAPVQRTRAPRSRPHQKNARPALPRGRGRRVRGGAAEPPPAARGRPPRRVRARLTDPARTVHPLRRPAVRVEKGRGGGPGAPRAPALCGSPARQLLPLPRARAPRAPTSRARQRRVTPLNKLNHGRLFMEMHVPHGSMPVAEQWQSALKMKMEFRH